jgi:hypothetical protein
MIEGVMPRRSVSDIAPRRLSISARVSSTSARILCARSNSVRPAGVGSTPRE